MKKYSNSVRCSRKSLKGRALVIKSYWGIMFSMGGGGGRRRKKSV